MFIFSQNGQRVDFQIQQGATLGPFFGAIENPDGSAIDITGVVVTGSVFRVSDNSLVSSLDIAIPTPSNGLVSFSLASSITASLTASLPDLPALYFIQVQMTWPNGQVVPFLNGTLIVTNGVDQ